MPPRRSKVKSASNPANPGRRSTRQSARRNDAVPNVYQEMLAEAVANSDPIDFEPSPRPQKRRKVSQDSIEPILLEQLPPPITEPIEDEVVVTEEQPKPQQVIFDDFENSDDSDVDFEDVELEPTVNDDLSEPEPPQQEILQLDLSKPVDTTPKRIIQRRKPITKVDRDKCINVHKWHLMSLLLHQLSRNIWCENEQVHAILKPLVSRKTISLLHPKDSLPAFEQNHSFVKGIEELCSIWQNEWQTTVRGLRRAYWDDTVDAMDAFDDAEDPVDFDDFKTAAQIRQGSRDLGAQLFCALLRSVAVDARLVFSIQALPFSGEFKPQVQESLNKLDCIQAPPQAFGRDVPISRSSSKKKITDSAHPIFWVEVLNPATTTWIPVDPLVRKTINKPKTQFEPPASDILNSMAYVIAFEDDNTARDVTRRYVQWYNAKTRKNRIENIKGGEEWYQSVMHVFERKFRLPRDLVEDDQLLKRAAAEGLPKNVQDFKNHPLYVLERHLRRNEVIEPKREVGKISSGPAKIGKLESVFRRQDVYLCRSADAWYRRGMDVRIGEQPLKRVMSAKRRDRAPSEEDEDDEEDRTGIALYAEYQTQVYEPPPVINGKIPKNAYGNLDVYVPSMIPPGAVHIVHPMASQAAKVLGLDYADAVTGFNFKGRQGTAVVNGVVVSAQYTAAMTAIIEALESQGSQEVQAERSRIILSIWKHMLTALRIRDKLEQEYGEKLRDEEDIRDGSASDDDSTYQDDRIEDDGGGFMLEAEETVEKVEEQNVSLQGLKSKLLTTLPDEVVQLPIRIIKSPHKLPSREAVNIAQARDYEMITERVSQSHDSAAKANGGDITTEMIEEDMGGGFMPGDNHSDTAGGGFMIEDEDFDGSLPVTSSKQDLVEEDDLFNEDTNGHSNSTHPDTETTAPAPSTTNSEEGGGFIPEEEGNEMEATNTIINNIQNPHQHGTLKTRTTKPPLHESKPTNNPKTPMRTPNNSDPDTDPGNNSETSTSTSLLSHDPAEDDDEPEWLVDAINE